MFSLIVNLSIFKLKLSLNHVIESLGFNFCVIVLRMFVLLYFYIKNHLKIKFKSKLSEKLLKMIFYKKIYKINKFN